MSFTRRLFTEAIVGLTGAGAVTRREERPVEVQSKTVVEVERHQYHEALQLLNEMRRIGGVRKVGRGEGDNGAPEGVVPDRVMRHTDFAGLNEHIQNGTEYSPGVHWGEYRVMESERVPGQPTRVVTREQAMAASVETTQNRHVTLQEEFFGR